MKAQGARAPRDEGPIWSTVIAGRISVAPSLYSSCAQQLCTYVYDVCTGASLRARESRRIGFARVTRARGHGLKTRSSVFSRYAPPPSLSSIHLERIVKPVKETLVPWGLLHFCGSPARWPPREGGRQRESRGRRCGCKYLYTHEVYVHGRGGEREKGAAELALGARGPQVFAQIARRSFPSPFFLPLA